MIDDKMEIQSKINYYSEINKMYLFQKMFCLKSKEIIERIRKNNSYNENLILVAYYLLKGLNEQRE